MYVKKSRGIIKTMQTIIAIDPGLNGGITILKDGRVITTVQLKETYGKFHGYNILNLEQIKLIVAQYIRESDEVILAIEKQTVMGRDTGKSAITTQTNYGILLALAHWAEANNVVIKLIHPRTWTQYVGDLNCEQLEAIENYPKGIRAKQSKLNAMAYVSNRVKVGQLPRNRNGNLYDGIIDSTAIALYVQEIMNENIDG